MKIYLTLVLGLLLLGCNTPETSSKQNRSINPSQISGEAQANSGETSALPLQDSPDQSSNSQNQRGDESLLTNNSEDSSTESTSSGPTSPSSSPTSNCNGLDAIFVFGQSNSANHGDVRDTNTDPNVLMFNNGSCELARDPLIGASGTGGSIWMPFAKAYVADHPGRKIVIVAIGEGGSRSQQWAVGGSLNSRLDNTAKLVVASGLNVKKVFWHQGETDNQLSTTSSQYVSNVESAFSTLRNAGIDAPISVAIASYLGFLKYNVSSQVQKGQFELIERNYPSVEIGIVSDFYHSPYRSADDIHFNGNGQRVIGEEWYRIALSPNRPQFNQQMVEAMYQSSLQRMAEPAGAAYWLTQRNNGTSWNNIYSQITNSDEGFIRSLYINYSKRLPEVDGFNYWLGQLSTRSRAQLQSDFINGSNSALANAALYADSFDFRGDFLAPRSNVFRFNQIDGLFERR